MGPSAGIHDLAAKVLSSQKLLGAYAALPTFWTLPTGFLTGSVARVDAQAEREMPGAATRPLFEEARRSAIAMSFGK